jgi:hypothetical protein
MATKKTSSKHQTDPHPAPTPSTRQTGPVARPAAPSVLPIAAPAKLSPEDEARIHQLVLAVETEDGMVNPPEWVFVADQAKRRGYVREHGLRLFLTDLGRQWLRSKEAPGVTKSAYTMTKISKAALLELKTISHETGIDMQEAIGLILGAIHDNRELLSRYSRRHGGEGHPWEAVAMLIRAARD